MSGTISGTTIGGSSAGDLTRAVEGSASAHSSGATVELYQLNGIPLTQINKTHSAIANIGIDSYTIATTAAGGASSGTGGGSSVTATENASMDVVQPFVPTIEFPDTSLSAKVRTTSGTSPSGTQNSFTKQTLSQARGIPVEDHYYFDNPQIVCSQVNETNELAGAKSLNLIYTMTSLKDNLSPVVDLDRIGVILTSNRINNPIDDFITEKWNFEGGTNDTTKHLRIPKIFIYPISKKEVQSKIINFPAQPTYLCEFLYGKNWKFKLKKDIEYEIRVIDCKPVLFKIKKNFLGFKKYHVE